MDKLIVGLGNPGREYEFTRHNIAWLLLDYISDQYNLTWKDKFKGSYSSYNYDGDKIYFLRPMTYMNLSGESVGPLCKFFKISKENILVVQDELDLPYGTISFKDGGGLAGHNGLKSISAHMGGNDFKRLRMGIGRPERGSVSDYVLGQFSSDQEIGIEKLIEGTFSAVEMFLKSEFKIVMNKYNKKKILE